MCHKSVSKPRLTMLPRVVAAQRGYVAAGVGAVGHEGVIGTVALRRPRQLEVIEGQQDLARL